MLLFELIREKSKLENEIREEEANIKLKQSDMKNLENEIETMNQMIKQLDTQKDVARKKLDEMAAQVRYLFAKI